MANHYAGLGPSNYYMQPQSPPPPPPNYPYGPGIPPSGGPNGYGYAYANPRVLNGDANGTPPFRPPYVYPHHQMPAPKYPPHAYPYNPYPPAWQQQQLSPLPKDDVPLSVTPGYYNAQEQPQNQHQHSTPPDFTPAQNGSTDPPTPLLPVASSSTSSASSSRPASPAHVHAHIPAESLLITPPASRSPSRTRMPSHPPALSPLSPSAALRSPSPTSPSPLSPRFASTTSPSRVGSGSSPDTKPGRRRGGGSWTISRFRPRDPRAAPGVMISPAARPPATVVEGAVAVDGFETESVEKEEPISKAMAVVESAEVAFKVETEAETAPVVDAPAPAAEAASAPEAETATPTPTPSSSSSSVTSAGATPAPSTDGARTPTTAVTTVPGSPVDVSASGSPVSAPALTPTPASTSTTATAPTPPTPAPVPVPTKSWASLLRAPASASASASASTSSAQHPHQGQPGQQPTRRALPTSSVVGISIPASATSHQIQADAERARRRAEVAKILSGSSPEGAGGVRGLGKLTPRGLINTGNMCFANAVLQALVFCPPFAGVFLRLRPLLEGLDGAGGGEGKDGGGGGEMIRATGTFLGEFYAGAEKEVGKANGIGNGNGKGKARADGGDVVDGEGEEGEAFIPTGVYDALKGKKRFDGMRGGQQEDAEEFLGFYLDTLEEELIAFAAAVGGSSASASTTSRPPDAGVDGGEQEVDAEPEGDGWLEVGRKNRGVVMRTIKATESPITRIFGGTFRSTLRAPGQKDSVIVEGWRALRIDIQRDQIHTVEDALAFLVRPQSVQLTRPTGGPLEASQQVLIDALPPVLIVHVKRFCYDTSVGGVVKVGKRIGFGPELEVGKEVMAGSGRKAVRYRLFGVIYHHGASAGGGHYTLDVLHPGQGAAGGWVRIDDELVSDVRPEDVFGANASKGAAERCAYLLFYRQIR